MTRKNRRAASNSKNDVIFKPLDELSPSLEPGE